MESYYIVRDSNFPTSVDDPEQKGNRLHFDCAGATLGPFTSERLRRRCSQFGGFSFPSETEYHARNGGPAVAALEPPAPLTKSQIVDALMSMTDDERRALSEEYAARTKPAEFGGSEPSKPDEPAGAVRSAVGEGVEGGASETSEGGTAQV